MIFIIVFQKRFLMGIVYIINQSGPVTMGASQVCGFVKSDASRNA